MSQKVVKRKLSQNDYRKKRFRYTFSAPSFAKMSVPRLLRSSSDIKYKDAVVRLTPTVGGGSAGVNGIDGASSGLFAIMNGFNIGSNDGQRIGRKITIRNISFFWNFHTQSDPAGLHCKVQWGMLLEKGTDATFAVFADAFDISTTHKPESTLKPDSLHKYKILWRDFLELPAISEIGSFMQPKAIGNGYLSFKSKKKGGIVEQFYKTDTGTWEDIQDNAIYLYYLTDTENSKYNLDVRYRIAYSDV